MTSELKKITVKTDNLENSAAPLYFQYQSQCQPQPAYIEIDPRGDEIIISADYNGNIGGGCSSDQWHNLVMTIACPSGVLGSALIDHLNSDDFQNTVRNLCEDYEEHWNGNNHVGRWHLGGDIEFATHHLESEFYDLEHAEVYEGDAWIEEDARYLNEDGNPCDWDEAEKAFYGDDPGVEITTENLEKLVADAEGYIDENLQLVTGLEDAFESIIENLN